MTLDRQAQARCWKYLAKLLGLSVEFWGLVFTHHHQDRTGWSHMLCRGHVQPPLWAVP